MMWKNTNMKMLKTKSFLYFFKIESGGMLIGWSNLIGCIAAFISCAAALIFLSLDNTENLVCSGRQGSCSEMFTAVLFYIKVATFVMVFVMILFTVISYQLIKGIEEKCPSRVEPMMKYYALMTVISTLSGVAGFLTYSIAALVFGCVSGMFFVYNFIVLYSLHDMFEAEYQEAIDAHNESKGSKQIYKEQILDANDLLSSAKKPLVDEKIEEV